MAELHIWVRRFPAGELDNPWWSVADDAWMELREYAELPIVLTADADFEALDFFHGELIPAGKLGSEAGYIIEIHDPETGLVDVVVAHRTDNHTALHSALSAIQTEASDIFGEVEGLPGRLDTIDGAIEAVPKRTVLQPRHVEYTAFSGQNPTEGTITIGADSADVTMSYDGSGRRTYYEQE